MKLKQEVVFVEKESFEISGVNYHQRFWVFAKAKKLNNELSVGIEDKRIIVDDLLPSAIFVNAHEIFSLIFFIEE